MSLQGQISIGTNTQSERRGFVAAFRSARLMVFTLVRFGNGASTVLSSSAT